EGKNLIVDRYSGGGQRERYVDLAREIIAAQPDAIYSVCTPITRALKGVTNTIPIVALTGDPIRFGLISSLAHPGGNVTGISVDAGLEIWGKRLEFLAEAVPKLAIVAYIGTQGAWENAGSKATREVAQKLGVSLQHASL